MNFFAEKQKNIYVIFFIFIAVYIAHFLLLNGYGLYEDDYAQARFISADMGFYDAIKYIYLDSARPVGRVLRYGLTWLGAEIGGLTFVYVIGYLIISFNCVLVYLIIRHISSDYLIPVIGALLFILYPADTTKILLTHSLQLYSAMIFALTSIYLYQQGSRILPYAFAVLSLLSYETTLLAILAAPFLKKDTGKGVIREAIKHALILVFLVVIALLTRSLLGESRVSGLGGVNPLELVGRIGAAMVIGPLVSAAMFVYRPVTTIIEADLSAYIVVLAFLGITFYFLRHCSQSVIVSHESRQQNLRSKLLPFISHLDFSTDMGKAAKLMMVGAVSWPFSYMFAFSSDHWPPTDIQGRMTSVHMAASFSASLTLAGLAWLFLIIFRDDERKKLFFVGVLSIYFSLLAGFSYVVQQDYVRSWVYQKEFWSQVIALTPDQHEKTRIFFQERPEYLKQTKYVLAHSWADIIVPDSFYDFDGYYKVRFHRLTKGIVKGFHMKDNKLFFKPPQIVGDRETEILPEDIIVLYRNDDGTMVRYKGMVNFNGINIALSQTSESNGLARTGIYNLIMGPD